MRLIWTLITLGAAAALFVIYQSNRVEDRTTAFTSKCEDSYPAAMTPSDKSTEDMLRFKLSCKPNRFTQPP